MKRLFAGVMAAMLLAAAVPVAVAETSEATNGDISTAPAAVSADYAAYIAAYEEADHPDRTLICSAAEFSGYTGAAPQAVDGAVLLGENCTVSYTFAVPTAGLYKLRLEYSAAPGKGVAPERSLLINGAIPFSEAADLKLNRVFRNERDFAAATNEYRPNQVETVYFETVLVSGSGIESDTVFDFYFHEGTNTITLGYIAEPVLMRSVALTQQSPVPDYAAYRARYADAPAGEVGEIRIQGEDAVYKSDSSLYPICDRSSPANEPTSAQYTKLNAIGGENWSASKQWITWSFTAERAGWYRLGLRVRQNFASGEISTRRLLLDGEVPFDACNSIAVGYRRAWQMFSLDSETGEPYAFYLTAGEHTLTLYNTVGVMAPVLTDANTALSALNGVYRHVMMITGSSPDSYRDYHLDTLIPEDFAVLEQQIPVLREICSEIERLTGGKGSGYASVQKLLIQIEGFVENPGSVPKRLSTFRSNITDVSAWVLDSIDQPLTVDYLVFVPEKAALPAADAQVSDKIVYGFQRFFLSFINDYNAVTSDGNATPEKSVTLWMGATAAATSGANVIGSGRDQANSLKNLADTYFTPETGVAVKVRLVDISSLLPAVASGLGPDVAIGQERATPMNYAYRGAVYDLSQFADCDTVLERFFPESYTAFRYKDSVYALPETFVFSLMFYRTDILDELGVAAPNTWEDLYRTIPVLSNHYMTVGLPLLAEDNIELFLALLYQNGGAVYNDDYTACRLAEETSINAFTRWTDFYTKYGVDQKVNLLTRFRTGESPIVITQYSFYNQLVATAPELNGKWSVCLVPDIGDGNKCVYGTGTGAVIFNNSKKKDEAWSFLKWWTAADTQVKFNTEIEAILGEAGRVPTANREALQRFPWTARMLSVLEEQAAYAKGLPEVPGSYLTTRYLSMAARLVINNGVLARDSVMSYAESLDDEIASMRREFGLDS